MDHAVRTVGLGGNVGRNVVGLDFDVVAHAAAGRQDGDVGQAFRQHARHFGHGRAAADGDGIDAAEKVIQEQGAAASQFFFCRLIAVTVTGNDIDILQAQFLPDLALHVVEVVEAQETFQKVRHEALAFRLHGDAQGREAHDAAAPQDVDMGADDAFRKARKARQCTASDRLCVGNMPQQ